MLHPGGAGFVALAAPPRPAIRRASTKFLGSSMDAVTRLWPVDRK
jgi:hypothetical protein